MESPPQRPRAGNRWRTWILGLMLALAGIGVFVIPTLRHRLPTVMILPFHEPPRSKVRVMADCALAWLKNMLGFKKEILLSASIVEFKSPLIFSGLLMPPPEYSDTNGLQVWILKQSQLQSMRETMRESPAAQFISNPRIQTVNGIEGAVFVGQTVLVKGAPQEVGVGLRCLPRIRDGAIDLTSTLTFTEAQGTNLTSIKTNAAVRSQIQIPAGSGLFLLHSDDTAADGRITGVLISANVQ